jgi:hypothetical protein
MVSCYAIIVPPDNAGMDEDNEAARDAERVYGRAKRQRRLARSVTSRNLKHIRR